ncbi:MAG TPA: hypothetical protein PK379_07365 [Candidatus Hydrogenedentes bacterium]|nr:hypothetical protein [Candidatus Hydrogenedentota bacterium]HOJ67780.1 hypothetical protein [Candidatus Hydrogenedentota bacterium]HOK89830.1 hypothetical protein [Candidatus Hydrogenedentota bacterium]
MGNSPALNVAILAGPSDVRRPGGLCMPPVEARYLAALARAAAAQDSTVSFRVLVPENMADWFDGLDITPLESPGLIPGGWRRVYARALRQEEVDLAIAPFRMASCVPWNVRAVLFGADLLDWPLPLSAAPPPPGPAAPLKRAVAHNGVDYFGPSRAFQKRFAELFDVGYDRITVIPPGLDQFDGSSRSGPVVAPPYVVFILNRHTREFWPGFLRFRNNHPDLLPGSLVVLGDQPEANAEEDPGPVLWLERCPAAYLGRIFSDAAVVCCLAREDYAGIDLLGALRAGARILAVRSGSAPEWAGEDIAFCDPGHEPSMARALRILVEESPEASARRIERQYRAVKGLNWTESAWKLITLLRRHAA